MYVHVFMLHNFQLNQHLWLAHGVKRQHGKAARRVGAFAAKRRIARVLQQPFSTNLLHVLWSCFLKASSSACMCTCCTIGMCVEAFSPCCSDGAADDGAWQKDRARAAPSLPALHSHSLPAEPPGRQLFVCDDFLL